MLKELLREHWVPALVAIGLAAPAAYWMTETLPPLEVVDARVVEGKVTRGEHLHVRYDLRYHKACRGYVSRMVSDSLGIVHLIEPTRTFNPLNPGMHVTPGTVSDLRVRIPVPTGAAPGPATYQARIEYYCNPLQRFLDRPIVFLTPEIDFVISDEPPVLDPNPPFLERGWKQENSWRFRQLRRLYPASAG